MKKKPTELAKMDKLFKEELCRPITIPGVAPQFDHPTKPSRFTKFVNAEMDQLIKDIKEKHMSNVPKDAAERKNLPVARGVLDYFPLALLEVAHVSKVGNDQHNPGEPLHWARNKSTDHADCIVRHLLDRGKIDSDLVRHSAKVAWRALALLQEEMEDEISE